MENRYPVQPAELIVGQATAGWYTKPKQNSIQRQKEGDVYGETRGDVVGPSNLGERVP